MPESLRVLVVDDEPVVAEALALAVRALGVPAEVVHDGAAALESARKDPPSLVLLDVLLPKMDGLQVLRALRAEHPNLPVVMISGIYKKRQQVQEALQQGAREYLAKPLATGQLWEMLERQLGRRATELRLDTLRSAQFVTRPLPQVVGELHASGETGLLLLRAPSGSAVLFLEDGRLVFARCSHLDGRLDRALAAASAPPTCVARAAQLLDSGMAPAQVLESLGRDPALTPEILASALTQQQRLHATLPFTWPGASTCFMRSDLPRHEPVKVAFDVPALVAWGCRHLADDDALARWLPPAHARVRLAGAAERLGQELGLARGETEFLALLDGTRDVGSLRAIGRLAQVDVNRLLAALTCLGRIQHETKAEPRQRGATLPPLPAGMLKRRPAARKLLELHRAGSTGIVRFEAGIPGAESRVVYMERGQIAFASSTRPEDRIGAVLVATGVITPEQLVNALDTARQRPDLALGRILLDAKAVSPDDLHAALVMQVRQVVCGLVASGAGALTCHEAPLQQRDVVPLALDTLDVVLDAVRAVPQSETTPMDTGPPLRISAAGRELAAHLPLRQDELAMLTAVAAAHAASRLLPVTTEDGTAAVLATLWELGLVEEAVAAVEPAQDERGGFHAAEPATDALDSLPELDEPDIVPVFRQAEPAQTGFELLGGTAPGRGVAAAAAVAPPVPRKATAADLPAIDEFLQRLDFHLGMRGEKLPAEVLDALPAHLRERFGKNR